MANRMFKAPVPGMIGQDMTVDSVVIMELSEEIRYMKREFIALREIIASQCKGVDKYLEKHRKREWKQRQKNLKASKKA